ncbi:MAG: adenylyl-sulfate kinase [Bernardetiaceae bacterium]
MNTAHIYPLQTGSLPRSAREDLLAQRGCVLWFTGLSGSGKSTLAQQLEHQLHREGRLTQLLDGDNIRSGLNADLGFDPQSRHENIRRIAEVARLFVQTGVITLVSFISPMIEDRTLARAIIGAADFKEIFVDTPLSVCESRDVKGLYAKARAGEIRQFTGIDAPYEAPPKPDIHIFTENQTIEESLTALRQQL